MLACAEGTVPRRNLLLGPLCRLHVEESRQSLVWLSTKEAEKRLEELVDCLFIRHGLDPLREWLSDLNAELLASCDDPQIDGDCGVVQNAVDLDRRGAAGARGGGIDILFQVRWGWVEDELW